MFLKLSFIQIAITVEFYEMEIFNKNRIEKNF